MAKIFTHTKIDQNLSVWATVQLKNINDII